MVDAITLLRAQHGELRALLQNLEGTSCPHEGPIAFTHVAARLAAHTRLEEQLLYPAASAQGDRDLSRMVAHAIGENLVAKEVMAELLDMSAEDPTFATKLRLFERLVLDHLDEAEQELLPRIARALTAADRQRLGEEMRTLFDTLLRYHTHDRPDLPPA